MFDVGFTELVLLFVIGLLILGPERLPRVASQLGRWVGRARRTANQLRHQLEREVALEEMNKTQRRNRTKSGPDAAAQSGPHGASGSSTPGDEASAAGAESGPEAAAPGAADPDPGGAPDSAPGDDGPGGPAAGEPTRRGGAEAERTDESSSA